MRTALVLAAGTLVPSVALAQVDRVLAGDAYSDRPLFLMAALAAMSLVPLLVIMVTSFVKIIVVLNILRQGMGLQQVPPTEVLTGIALVMSSFVMAPVVLQASHNAQDSLLRSGLKSFDLMKVEPVLIEELVTVTQEPLRAFLKNNSEVREREFFLRIGSKMRSTRVAAVMTEDDYSVLTPAFVMSELKEAFYIGFMLYMPFLVLDMVVANILMALGMQMLQPTVISLPFKILMFVAADGWHLIAKGLSISYL